VVERTLDRVLLHFTIPDPSARIEALEGQMLKLLQLAESEKTIAHVRLDIRLAAGADRQPPEIRMAEWHVLSEIANALAMRAAWIARHEFPGFSVR
jgi:hypothetical protein